MYKIIICDDEKNYRDLIEDYITKYSKLKMIETETLAFSSGSTLLANKEDWIRTNDIMFLDIKMGDENGIDIGKECRMIGYSEIIVFLTSTPNYVFDSFDAKPLNYILKQNITFESFKYEFEKILAEVNENKSRMFSYSIGKDKHMILLKKVIAFEIRGRKVFMSYLDSGSKYMTVEFYSSLESIEEKVKGLLFLKPHRSFLVNPSYIKSVGKSKLVMKNGEEITITRKYKDTLNEKFCEYLELAGIEL